MFYSRDEEKEYGTWQRRRGGAFATRPSPYQVHIQPARPRGCAVLPAGDDCEAAGDSTLCGEVLLDGIHVVRLQERDDELRRLLLHLTPEVVDDRRGAGAVGREHDEAGAVD